MERNIQFAAFAIIVSYSLGGQRDCHDVTCIHGGTPFETSSLCWCNCTAEFTGIICETRVEASVWPEGPYSLPMSKFGCPETRSQGWLTGYISVVTMDTNHVRSEQNAPETDDIEDAVNITEVSVLANRTWSTAMMGPVWENGFVIHFCTKSKAHRINTGVWPNMVTTVYQVDRICPQGFVSGPNITWDVPNVIALNTDGRLPDIDIKRSDNSTAITMFTCIQDDSSREISDVDHYNNVLVPLVSEECPPIEGLDIKHEAIVLDIMDDQMVGNMTGASSKVMMEYCLYKLSMSQEPGLQPLNEEVPDLENLYQVPFQNRNQSKEPSLFWRSRLLYGIQLHSIFPEMVGPRVIVRDMYGIHSYTGESGMDPFYNYKSTAIPTQPFFNIPDISMMEEKSWIMVKLQGIQTVTSVYVALKIDNNENPESIASNSDFQNPEIRVSNFDTHFKNHGAFVVEFTSFSFYKSGIKANDYYPHKYNLDLSTPHVVVEHRFKKPQSCQYLMISLPSHQLTDEDQKKLSTDYFNRMVGINLMGTTTDGMNFCGGSSVLQDYQLTASSSQASYPVKYSGLHSWGWCAELTDSLPYIQVDLLFPAIIGGVRVLNWQSVEGLQLLDLGARSFSLNYGFDVDNFIPYGDKDFEIDITKPFDHIHTFLFEERILARFIRIYPSALDSIACLQFELIQCYTDEKADLSMDCSNNSVIVNTTSSFASFKQPMETNITSWSECKELCDVHECSVFEFLEKKQSCLVYEYNIASSVRTILQDDDSNSTLSTYFCLKDAGISEGQRAYHTIHGEGTLTSAGFPLGYRTGEVTTWLVKVDDGMFVQVLFTNISLNVYPNEKKCSDRISISVSQYGRFQAERELEYVNPIKKEITSISNGEYITYWGESSAVFVTFESCENGETPAHIGTGFRALIRQTDAPFCSGGWDIEYRFQMPCSQRMMNFGSETYLDSSPLRLSDEYMVFYLHLFGGAQGNVRYVELMITDLVIPCKSENIQFIIDDIGAGKQTPYCTHNRPPYIIKSTLWGLTIKMTYSSYIYTKDYQDNRWHGFFGHYKFITNNETVYNWTTSKKEEYTPWEFKDYGIYAKEQWTVCSDKLSSCYTFFPTMQSNGSWTKSQEICMSYGQNLVTLNTDEEYQYVRLMAENYTRYTRYVYDSHYIHLRLNPGERETHIGLTRFQHGSTMIDMWLDGTPLVFSAWTEGQPSNPVTKQCTKMRLLSYSADNTWYTDDCYSDNSLVGNFICEKHMEQSKGYSNISGAMNFKNSPYNTLINWIKVGLFQCTSGEYLSWISVCNGFPECADNSDETGCNQDGCSNEEFQCNNGRCISYNLVCDDHIDCLQGEDELCSFKRQESDIYRCENDQIIHGNLACNGKLDCFDGSDEKWCVTCSSSTQCLGLGRTCLPWGLYCDGYMDCSDGKDEQSCSKFPIDTCNDWWGLGYKENGVYEIGGAQIRCNFDHINDRKTITYLPLDLVYTLADTSMDYFTNTLLTFDVNQYMYDTYFDTCQVTVLETLQPAIKRVLDEDNLSYEMDQVFGSTEFSTITYNQLFSTSDQDIQKILGSPDGSDISPRKRLLYNDVTCTDGFYNRFYSVPCAGRFQAVSPYQFCIWGACRSMSHLWNCEDYVCPSNYIKCPGSFCIPADLMCDGRVHCPGGEDVLHCYCKDNKQDVYIIALDQGGENQFKALYHFSQQFLSLTNIVSLNLISIPDLPTYTEFDLKSERVKMLDYRLRQKTAKIKKELTLNRNGLIDFITTDRQDQRSHDNQTNMYRINDYTNLDIIVIDDVTTTDSIWDVVFSSQQNIPDKIKPYRVLLDDSIRRPADLREYPGFMEVKLQKIDLLEHGGVLLFENICEARSKESCKNGFKCQSSPKCLPLELVCDGYINCPFGDDERICSVTCPRKCSCHGYIVDCNNRNFISQDFGEIPRNSRILDLSNNPSLSTETFRINKEMLTLIKLDLSDSGLKSVDEESFRNLPMLQSLDLRNNLFTIIPTFTFWHLKSLLELHISGNRFINFIADQAFTGLDNIQTLSITGTSIEELTTQPFVGLNLDLLDISGNVRLRTINDGPFNGLNVKHIDFENCPIKSFTADMFTGISDLEEMAASAFKFCCIRPQTVLQSKCTPYQDEFSSCEDLMRDVSQRALLWIIGLLALIGNSLVLVYRLIIDRSHLKLGHSIFVTNLAFSDFLMGFYLIIIAIADQVFRDRYIWMEDYWRTSGWCTFAGVLSTVSSESSILFISLITLDRILVIKFPFGQVRFRTTTALASVAGCWILVILLSIFPLMFSDYFQNEFYSKSGVCIALPLSHERYSGWLYSIVIFVGFNFVTFMLIAFGQILIFLEVRKSSQKFKKGKSTRANDLKVARNLLLVVSTDFLCWGPVGIMGLMSVGGSIIPPTVYAWTAVLILPVNSALNPFLYTVSALINRNAFKPRLDEQTKLDPNELLLLKRVLHLWKTQFTICKRNDEKNDQAIATITKLPTAEVGKMALRLAICLRFLHKLHFKMDGITFLPIEKDSENEEDIPFIVDPSLRANDKEMAEDMLNYGKLLQSLLEIH